MVKNKIDKGNYESMGKEAKLYFRKLEILEVSIKLI
jgi:hypothetical protein